MLYGIDGVFCIRLRGILLLKFPFNTCKEYRGPVLKLDNALKVPWQAVLRREIPWSTYMSARLLSDKDLQLIRKFDKKSEATQAQLLEEVDFVCWEAEVPSAWCCHTRQYLENSLHDLCVMHTRAPCMRALPHQRVVYQMFVAFARPGMRNVYGEWAAGRRCLY